MTNSKINVELILKIEFALLCVGLMVIVVLVHFGGSWVWAENEYSSVLNVVAEAIVFDAALIILTTLFLD